MSALPIFHGLVILNTARWINYSSECVTETDYMPLIGQCDLYFTVQWLFMRQIHYSFVFCFVFLARRDSGELRCPAYSFIYLFCTDAEATG